MRTFPWENEQGNGPRTRGRGYKSWWEQQGQATAANDYNSRYPNQRTYKGYSGMNESQLDTIIKSQQETMRRQGFQEKMPNGPAVKAKKHPAGLGKLGWGFVGVDTVMNMKAGDSFGTAAAKGVVSGMLWTTMPGIMTAHMLATSIPGGVSAFNQYKRQKELWWNQAHRPNFGGQYQDTRRAQTMRQAAVEAIQGSKMNARSALGGEAKILNQNMYRG